MRVLLNDESIGSALVGKSLKYLGEAQIRSIANWSLRKSDLPSHTFVIVCGRELTKKGL